MSDQTSEPAAAPAAASLDECVRLVIEAIDERPAKDGNGVNVSVRLCAIDGPHKGRAMFYTCPMERDGDADAHPAVRWGRRQLALLCLACGKDEIEDTDELLGLMVRATVRANDAGFLDVVRLEPNPQAAQVVSASTPAATNPATTEPTAPVLDAHADNPPAESLRSADVLKITCKKQTDAKHHVAARVGGHVVFDDAVNIMSRKDRQRFVADAVKHCPALGRYREEIEAQLVEAANNPTKGAEDGADVEPGQGGELSYRDDAPWPEPVDGVRLLNDIRAQMHRFCVLPDHADVACALWALHTHALDFIEYTPRLAFCSAEKRSGKSRAMRIVGAMTRRKQEAENCTTAVLFRLAEKHRPTLLLDEADAWLVGKNADDSMRGILNSGVEPSGQVMRCVGDKNPEPRTFNVYAPVALAMIGRPPGTIEDRSIVVQMRRALPSEKRERPHLRTLRDDVAPIRQRCARFIVDHGSELRDADPELPSALDDRAADCWRPLIALADLAGGEWPTLARNAAVALSAGRDVESSTRGTMLLIDTRTVFDERKVERIASEKLAEALAKMEERPWGEWRRGRPITPVQVARLLAPYDVKPSTMRLADGSRLKGYARDDFADAWARYAPASPASDPCHRDKPQGMRASGENGAVTASEPSRIDSGQEARNLGDVTASRLKTAPPGVSSNDGNDDVTGDDADGLDL